MGRSIATRLEEVGGALATARDETSRLVERRNKLVLDAVDDGWSYSEIAELIDLTKAGVQKIVDTERRER